MKKPHHNGFALIVVISLMALMAAALVVLTTASNSLKLQTNRAYLQARQRNLFASAVAWAEHCAVFAPNQLPQNTQELDLAGLADSKDTLTVSGVSTADNKFRLNIRTICTRRRLTFHRDFHLVIPRSDSPDMPSATPLPLGL